MFLGLDCSTQSLSALLINAEGGTIEHEESVNFQNELPQYKTTHGFERGDHPDEFFSNPMMWLDALDLLFSRLVEKKIPLNKIKGISGSAQQHATVYIKRASQPAVQNLDPRFSLSEQLQHHFSRPVSPIWLDASTEPECQEIINAVGDDVIRKVTGSSVTPRFSASQIRKYAKQYPERWAETEKIHLVSSYLNSVLAGHRCSIDYGDGAGMNLMNLERFQWDKKIANAVFPELIHKLPSLQASTNMSGMISSYFVEKYGFHQKTRCFNWSGDNLCSLVGMGASRPGKWVMSLGTSYTVFCSIEVPRYDPDGFGNVFGNPIEDYMALSCFKNGALACFTLKDQLGIDWIEFDQQARTLPTMDDSPSLPFYETEITPRHRRVSQCDSTVRSHLDGQFLNMKHHSRWMGDPPTEIFVTGGVSKSKGVCQTIANIFQAKVHRLSNSSSASLGAAMRAAYSTGYTLDELEQKFCQPYDHILPQIEAAPIYEKQMERFLAKLRGN